MSTSIMKDDTYITSVLSREYGYTWVINNFSTWFAIVEEKQFSPKFGQYQWQLIIDPRTEGNVKYFGLYVTQPEIKAEYKMSILDSEYNVIEERSFSSKLKNSDWGWGNFTSVNNIESMNTLIIKCKITITNEIINECIDGYRNQLPKPLASSFSNDFKALIDNNEKFGDVTILIDDQRFLAYKGILAARSSVFAVMFAHEMRESIENSVSIDDIEPDVFKELLRYIYTDELTCLDTMAHKLYAAAEKYDIPTLKSLCRYHLMEKLSWETAAESLLLADLHNDIEMKALALKFLSGSVATKVTETEGWKELVKSRPCLVDEVVKAMAATKLTICDTIESKIVKK